jgi:hypothetical protein
MINFNTDPYYKISSMTSVQRALDNFKARGEVKCLEIIEG